MGGAYHYSAGFVRHKKAIFSPSPPPPPLLSYEPGTEKYTYCIVAALFWYTAELLKIYCISSQNILYAL
jgi:hypothetical protein